MYLKTTKGKISNRKMTNDKITMELVSIPLNIQLICEFSLMLSMMCNRAKYGMRGSLETEEESALSLEQGICCYFKHAFI
jgi:hypothetical protein